MNNIKSGLIHKEHEYAIRAWPISVVGRIIDFSIPGTSRESMMPDYMHDILGLLIRALENVTHGFLIMHIDLICSTKIILRP